MAILGAIRILELVIDRRHERRLRARGGYRIGNDGLPWIVLGQVALFLGLAAEGFLLPPSGTVGVATFSLLGLAAAALLVRHWCIWSLGDYWTIHVVIVPGARLITRGPYRFLRHPNYVAVAIESVSLCIAFEAWWTLLATAVLTGPALLWRIHREEAALRPLRGAQDDAKGPRQTT